MVFPHPGGPTTATQRVLAASALAVVSFAGALPKSSFATPDGRCAVGACSSLANRNPSSSSSYVVSNSV